MLPQETLDELLARLASSRDGLSAQEANRRLGAAGANMPARTRRRAEIYFVRTRR